MAQRESTVGVIGLGFGRSHIPAFQANGCRVVAVCQRNRAQAQAIADRYAVPGVFEHWEEMLEKAEPDIVAIATPPHLHKAIALAAFARGAHVLCEKPLALTAMEAREIVEAGARAGRVGMTNFNWRWPAAMQRFHAMVEEGFLGRLLHAQVRWLGARFADETIASTWRMDRAEAGHGALGDAGVHAIDFIRWHFGEITRVVGQSSIAYPSRTVPGGDRPTDTEDVSQFLAELASGGQVAFTISRAARGANEQTIEAYGTAGALRYGLPRDVPRWHRGQLHATTGPNGAFAPVAVKAVVPRAAGEGELPDVIGRATIAPLVKRLLVGIRKKESPSPSLEDGWRAQLVLDAILHSAATRTWQEVIERPVSERPAER
jgi:predicted dehydrogenase